MLHVLLRDPRSAVLYAAARHLRTVALLAVQTQPHCAGAVLCDAVFHRIVRQIEDDPDQHRLVAGDMDPRLHIRFNSHTALLCQVTLLLRDILAQRAEVDVFIFHRQPP